MGPRCDEHPGSGSHQDQVDQQGIGVRANAVHQRAGQKRGPIMRAVPIAKPRSNHLIKEPELAEGRHLARVKHERACGFGAKEGASTEPVSGEDGNARSPAAGYSKLYLADPWWDIAERVR